MVDAKDCDGRWFEGKIAELHISRFNFFEWSKKLNEWIVLYKEIVFF